MIIGTVVGNVVSTKKNEKLVGCKLMIIQIEGFKEIVALDNIGTGIGDQVIVTCGHNAVNGLPDKTLPVDAAIVGIVD